MRPIRTPANEAQGRAPRRIALPELLGTPKGIAALSEFIKDSGAFAFTGEKYTPKDLPTFFEEPEPPDIDSEEDDSDAEP